MAIPKDRFSRDVAHFQRKQPWVMDSSTSRGEILSKHIIKFLNIQKPEKLL